MKLVYLVAALAIVSAFVALNLVLGADTADAAWGNPNYRYCTWTPFGRYCW